MPPRGPGAVFPYGSAINFQDADGNRPGLVNYGTVLFHTGRLQEALEFFQHAIDLTHQSLDIFLEFEDSFLEAMSLENLGQMHQRLGEYSAAFEFQRRALTIFQEYP